MAGHIGVGHTLLDAGDHRDAGGAMFNPTAFVPSDGVLDIDVQHWHIKHRWGYFGQAYTALLHDEDCRGLPY